MSDRQINFKNKVIDKIKYFESLKIKNIDNNEIEISYNKNNFKKNNIDNETNQQNELNVSNAIENKSDNDLIIFDDVDDKELIKSKKIKHRGKKKKSNIEKNNENNINKSFSEIIDEQLSELDVIINRPYKSKRKFYDCNQCKIIFKNESDYNEHNLKHDNQNENDICMCKKCGLIFNNDELFYIHRDKCLENVIDDDNIPMDINGKYKCPSCDNKYSNTFLLGEHFILSHDNYNVLCSLDEKNHNGFPGFDLLIKINMIKYLNKKKFINKLCGICVFSFTDDNYENIISENRNPVKMKCCKRLICCNCLMNHIMSSDTIICPYCRKDHTQTELDYIIFVDISDVTEREKWIPWWENHIDIFN